MPLLCDQTDTIHKEGQGCHEEQVPYAVQSMPARTMKMHNHGLTASIKSRL